MGAKTVQKISKVRSSIIKSDENTQYFDNT